MIRTEQQIRDDLKRSRRRLLAHFWLLSHSIFKVWLAVYTVYRVIATDGEANYDVIILTWLMLIVHEAWDIKSLVEKHGR